MDTIHPHCPGTRAAQRRRSPVSADEYGAFLCAVFDEWILNDLGQVEVQLFAETARVLNGGEAGLCWMAPTCGRVLVVEHDGGVYSCDHFVTPEHRLGDIGDIDTWGRWSSSPDNAASAATKKTA